MSRRSGRRVAVVAAALCALASTPAAQAEDFFSALFGGFGGHRSQAPSPLSFANEGNPFAPQGEARPRPAYSGGGGQASRPVPAMLASAYAARPPGPSGGVIPAASSVTTARLP